MEEWNNEKFSHLLTSSLWKSNALEIKNILSMSEWDDERFSHLLTPSIWNSSYKAVKDILSLPYWNSHKYDGLLKPSIFSLSLDNITAGMTLLSKYGIDEYATNGCLRNGSIYLGKLLEYLKNNNYSLTVMNTTGDHRHRLNPILSATSKRLREDYGIDVKTMKGVDSFYARH